MANRFPLILNGTQIQEIANGDGLDLTGNSILNATGIATANLTINGQNFNSYLPTALSDLTNDIGLSVSYDWPDITNTPTTLAGYGITDAFSGNYGDLLGTPTNISDFVNDTGFITLAEVVGGIDVNPTGDLVGSVFADDSTLLVDGVNGVIPYPANVGVVWDGIAPTDVVSALDRLASYTQDFTPSNAGDWTGALPADITDAIDRLAARVTLATTSDLVTIGKVGGQVDIYGAVEFTTGTTVDFTNATVNGLEPGGLVDIVSDQTPQLGGELDMNSQDITGTGNINITGTVTASDFVSSGAGTPTLESATDINLDAGNAINLQIGSVTKLSVNSSGASIPGYISVAALQTALQDGAGDYAAFKAYILGL